MAVSNWFNYNVYMTNKVAQLKTAEPAANWTIDKVAQAFADLGYGGIEGAERHFMDFGQNEDVAPNAFFNPTEYYRAKAAQAYGKDVKDVTDTDAALVKAAIKGLGMNAWSHYDTFGSDEKVNPSNQFDTEAYMKAKMDALNANLADGQTAYKIEDVYAAFKAAGMSALEHFMLFGGSGKGEVAQAYDPKNPAIPTEFAVPENKKVKPAGSGTDGETYTLTIDVDTVTGTSGNDEIVGTWTAAADGAVGGTLSLGDKINGGEGTDTLIFTSANRGTGGAAAPTVVTGFNTTSVEKIVVTATGTAAGNTTTFDASTSKDAVEYWSEGSNVAVIFGTAGSAAQAITKNATIGLKETSQDVTATFANALVSGAADTGNVALAGGVGIAGTVPNVTLNGVTTSNGFETININSTGTANSLGTLVSGTNSIKTVNLSGTANVNIANVNSTELKSIDASKMTGSAGVNIGAQTSDSTALSFIGSANNDRLVIDSAVANAANTFSLNGGAGRDTLAISGSIAFDASSAGLVSTVNKAAGFEVLEATNAGTRALKANEFTGIHEFLFSAVGSGDLTLTGVETADKFSFSANQTAAGQGDAITFTGAGPGQTANLVLSSGITGVAIEGGKGEAGKASATNGTDAGAAIVFGGSITTLHIESTGGTANSIKGGDAGSGGATGSGTGGNASVAIDNGAIGTVIITGTQDLSILGGDKGADVAGGTSGGAASLNAFTGAVNVDASKLEAKLTIAGSASGDIITVGTKGSEVHATEGSDSITFGAGNDTIVYTNVNQSLTGTPTTNDTSILTTIDKLLDWGKGVDKLNVKEVTGATGGGFTSAEFVAQNVVQAAVDAVSPTNLKDAAEAAGAKIGADKIGVFQYGGNTYVLGNDGTAGTLAAGDLLVQVAGTHTLTADNFVFA